MATVSVFANFRINDQERFQRLKDSFESFCRLDVQEWVINVRGSYKLDVLFFLHDRLGNRLKPFVMESEKGWFHDSRKMLSSITGDYVIFWIEDHILQAGTERLAALIDEMQASGSEYLPYSFFPEESFAYYKSLCPEIRDTAMHFTLDKPGLKRIMKQGWRGMIIGAVSILSGSLFRKVISANDPFFKRWPVQTPFDFEKGYKDTHWLPVRYAIPLEELFASIDVDVPGCDCLQTRGAYPARKERQQMNPTIVHPVLKKIKKMIPIWVQHRINRFRKKKYS